jgi:hypothetical protein
MPEKKQPVTRNNFRINKFVVPKEKKLSAKSLKALSIL